MNYERKSNWTLGENKPNSKPIKANFQKAKMNANVFVTKDYENETALGPQKNKPNSNPISEKPKMNVNLYVIKEYENICALGVNENKPNSNPIRTQTKPIGEDQYKTKDPRHKSEVRRQNAEDRRQSTDGRRQKESNKAENLQKETVQLFALHLAVRLCILMKQKFSADGSFAPPCLLSQTAKGVTRVQASLKRESPF